MEYQTMQQHLPTQHERHGQSDPRERRSYSIRAPILRKPAQAAFGVVALIALVGSLLFGLGISPSASAAPTTYSIWPSTTSPTVQADNDSRSVEVGVKFTSSSNGWVNAIRYFKSSQNTGLHTGSLWSSDGTRLARVTYLNETSSGWQTALLASPIQVKAGSTYTASYRATVGRYAGDTDNLSQSKPQKTYALTALAGVYTYGDGMPRSTWKDSNYYVDVVFTSGVTTTTPKPSTTATTPKPSTTPTSTETRGWPSALNTGVLVGTRLTTYTGPCTITSVTTFSNVDASACGALLIRAKVVIANSKLPRVDVTEARVGSVAITDSTIDGGRWSDGAVWGNNINVSRVNIYGGKDSVHCASNCTVVDSWLHDQYNPDGQSYHNQAFLSNGGSNMVLSHNTLHCTPILNRTDGGCTADVSIFGDFGPISNVTVENNLLKANASSISYCAYGGYEPNKKYPVAIGVRYINNVFERGPNGKCGVFGPITSFQTSASGNEWRGNKYADGTVIQP